MRASVTVGAFFSPSTNTSDDGAMPTWDYVIVELPGFEPATHLPGASAAVQALNEQGWEAVGMTLLAGGRVAVLLQKGPKPGNPHAASRAPGDAEHHPLGQSNGALCSCRRALSVALVRENNPR
jgi:hypothetical protein